MSKDENKPRKLDEKELNSVTGGATRSTSKTTSTLFFDEADSLLGKRTEVKDSNDRFSNPERK